MGLPHKLARAAVRFSFGVGNTTEDVDVILEVLPKLIERLRSFARA
jgi:cysteine sulfinate desulfinase/cysteine desulfurase-like protein